MSDRIEVDDILYPGSDRWSSNGQYQLILQEDNNFVLYRKIDDDNMEPIWASNTYSDQPDGNVSVILQRDGNFVLYNGNGQSLWSSESYGYGGGQPYILVQDDGNVVMYDAEMEGAFWNTGTY